jgi:hypothetical protein
MIAKPCRCGAVPLFMMDTTEKSDIICCSKFCGEVVTTTIKDEPNYLLTKWNEKASLPTDKNKYGNYIEN